MYRFAISLLIEIKIFLSSYLILCHSSYVKNIIIETHEVQCNIVNCVSCRI